MSLISVSFFCFFFLLVWWDGGPGWRGGFFSFCFLLKFYCEVR